MAVESSQKDDICGIHSGMASRWRPGLLLKQVRRSRNENLDVMSSRLYTPIIEDYHHNDSPTGSLINDGILLPA